MDEQIFQLFSKHLSKEITQEESVALQTLLHTNPEVQAHFEDFIILWEQTGIFKNSFNTDSGYEILKMKIKTRKQKPGFLLRAVAVFVGVLLVSGFLLLDAQRKTRIVASTNILQLTLRDSSKVVLNKGAVLSYSNPRIMPFKRKVSLQGEGYFEITHNPQNPFLVKTEEFDVQVLGTKFNVKTEENESIIILSEGKVHLMNFTNKHEEMHLNPGDMVTVNRKSRAVIKSKVNPDLFTIWKEKRIIFNHFNLVEVSKIIQNVFGKEVKINNNNLFNKYLNGSAPVDDLQVLLNALAEVLDEEIYLKNDTIIIN